MTDFSTGESIEQWRANRGVEPVTPAINLVKADQAALLAHWPFLRKKLLSLTAKFQRKAPNAAMRWVPEQVRFEIMKGLHGNGPVELFLALGADDEIKGYAITSCQMDPFRNVPLDLHVWLLSTWYPKVLESAIDQLVAIAKERGCTALEYTSPFDGWARRGQKLGFQMKFVVWRKEIDG